MPRTLKELKQFQKTLIEKPTKSEKKLKKKLESLGYTFTFQKIIQPFIADFVFKGKKIVELDSPKFHNPVRDASRDLYLSNLGYKIKRIKSYRVFKDLPKVLEEIKSFLDLK